MVRPTIFTLALLLLVAQVATAGQSFRPASLAPELGIDQLSRSVAIEKFDRELLGSTYQSVVIGQIDVYDRFPYLEAHYFQVVSDPKWNRLVFGETDRGLDAYSGEGQPFGALDEPRGLATDAGGRLYVADSGNDRVLVFETSNEFDQLRLTPVYAIEGLSRPFDVAVSDAGTPFELGDDLLYVANTGANEVRRYELAAGGAELSFAVGELGSGDLHFAGPMAIAVGREDGVNNGDVFVADAHNQRMVRLIDRDGQLDWVGGLPHDLGVVTGLESDHWGNLYAAAPQSNRLQKFTSELLPIAELSDGVRRPRSFHIPMVTTTDHRDNTRTRAGHGGGMLLEEWGDDSGLRLLDLGVEVGDLRVSPTGDLAANFSLSDHARVSAEIFDGTGRLVARHDAGRLAAGEQQLSFSDENFLSDLPAGNYQMNLRAESTYVHGDRDDMQIEFAMSENRSASLPAQVMLGRAHPNPFNPSTTLSFSIPTGPTRDFSLRIYDVRGRMVRELDSGQIDAGQHERVWNSLDDRGSSVASGIYHYRLEVGGESFSNKMVLVK